jgi:hypothetical protein
MLPSSAASQPASAVSWLQLRSTRACSPQNVSSNVELIKLVDHVAWDAHADDIQLGVQPELLLKAIGDSWKSGEESVTFWVKTKPIISYYLVNLIGNYLRWETGRVDRTCLLKGKEVIRCYDQDPNARSNGCYPGRAIIADHCEANQEVLARMSTPASAVALLSSPPRLHVTNIAAPYKKVGIVRKQAYLWYIRNWVSATRTLKSPVTGM